MDNATPQPSSSEQQASQEQETTQQSDSTTGQFTLRTKNLANLSPSQLKLLKESLGNSNTTKTSTPADDSKKHDELKSELDRMEMSDNEGKMSESENWKSAWQDKVKSMTDNHHWTKNEHQIHD